VNERCCLNRTEARGLAGATSSEVAGRLGFTARQRRTRLLLGLAGLWGLAVLLGFVSPDRTRAGWTPLLRETAQRCGRVLPDTAPLERLEVRRGLTRRPMEPLQCRLEHRRSEVTVVGAQPIMADQVGQLAQCATSRREHRPVE
jgi:hypothetical protein